MFYADLMLNPIHGKCLLSEEVFFIPPMAMV